MSVDPLLAEEFESRWEAAPAVGVAIVLQLMLAFVSRDRRWTVWDFHWWVWLIAVGPELLLLVPLAWKGSRRRLEQRGQRRTVSLALLATVGLGNALLVFAMIASLISGHETSGPQLLVKAMAVWGSNVITYGLWFWAFDRGGPVQRLTPPPPYPDFYFTQMSEPDLAPGWHPRLFDYLYISFTNSIAFSPTDVLPLTRRAKALMASESALSTLAILLVAARAVNIFK